MDKAFAKKIYFYFIEDEEEKALSIRNDIPGYFRPGEELIEKTAPDRRNELVDALDCTEAGGRADGFVIGMQYAAKLTQLLFHQEPGPTAQLTDLSSKLSPDDLTRLMDLAAYLKHKESI